VADRTCYKSIEREIMTDDEADKLEAILIMFNKILFIVSQTNAGNSSPEVAMEEIKSIIMGAK